MNLETLLILYSFIIVVLPALLSHLGAPFGIPMATWQLILDILMATVAVIGLARIIIKRKKKFRGWIPLLALVLLILVPQLYLWKVQSRGFTELRAIYRYALLYITLFIIPLEIHLHRSDICVLIGLFCLFILLSCGYAVVQNPRVWEGMRFFSGKSDGVMSWFGQKNRFGAYLALGIILCLLAIQLSGKKYWLFPAAIFAVFLVMSESRGAILLVAITMTCILFSYRRRLGTKNILFILGDSAIVLMLLCLLPPTRNFMVSLIGADRGVCRETMWRTAWEFFLESNPLLGHGLGTQIERIMIERARLNYSTHNMYLYMLISGGMLMILFYIGSFIILLKNARFRHHYLIPLMIGWAVYGFFELAGTPFDFWHLSNMFTVCLFFIPSALRSPHHHRERLVSRLAPVPDQPQKSSVDTGN